MVEKMIMNSEIAGLSEAELHYALCFANLDASKRLCADMIEGRFPASYSHASVVISLFHHGIELFLKHAISRAGKKVPKHHYIRGLLADYEAAFPEVGFNLEFPFITQYPGYSQNEIEEFIKEEQQNKNMTDQMGRYHLDKDDNPWEGIYAFDPTSFLDEIASTMASFVAVREEIGKIHAQSRLQLSAKSTAKS